MTDYIFTGNTVRMYKSVSNRLAVKNGLTTIFADHITLHIHPTGVNADMRIDGDYVGSMPITDKGHLGSRLVALFGHIGIDVEVERYE